MSGEEAVIHSMHSSLFHHLLSQKNYHLCTHTVIGHRLHTDTVNGLFPPGNVMVKGLASSSPLCPPSLSVILLLPVIAESDRVIIWPLPGSILL